MKVGIIGCGSISKVHGWALSHMEEAEIAAVCDIDETRAKEWAAGFCVAPQVESNQQEPCDTVSRIETDRHLLCKPPQIVTDWRALCEADLDVVHVCTPHDLHAPMAAALLKSGKAVFLEKPCAITREQYESLSEADRQHPNKLGICFQNRYNATTQTADRLIAEGRIGTVVGGRAFVTWRRDENYYTGSPWKGRKLTEGGGVLINQAIHTLDLLLRYLGKPEWVEASASNHHLQGIIETEDTVEAWMAFPGGKRACFYASNGYATDAPVILEIEGDKGRITISDQEVSVRTGDGTEHIRCEEGKGIGKGYWGAGHRACITSFYEAIAQGKPPAIGLSDAEVTFDTMMRIYESASTI